MNILLLSGSLRKISYSQALLDIVADILRKEEHRPCTYAIESLPFYTDKLERKTDLESISSFSQLVDSCDAMIFITPEYNHSIPAVLKNAIDWASRPAFTSPLKDKPVTFITQSNNSIGGARAQEHIKLIMDSTLSVIYPARELLIQDCHSRFDSKMKCEDEKVITLVANHIISFTKWAHNIASTR